MSIARFGPFSFGATLPGEFKAFQDSVSRWLDETTAGRPWTPAVDILETGNELILKADIPDVEMKDVKVEIEDGTLSIKGQRHFEGEKKDRGYHRIERSYGSFARYFTVPESIDTEKVAAEYKNGVLTVTLPKKEIAKPRTLKVQVKD
jgi:HSP20 family protein